MHSQDAAGMQFLTFHHVGLIVRNITDSFEHYAELFGKSNISDIYSIKSQRVKVCFVQMSPGQYIELVEPFDETSKIYGLLKKNISYYHIAYKTQDIHHAIAKLEGLNYKPLELFSSEAFNNKLCIFLFTPEGHLIELVESDPHQG